MADGRIADCRVTFCGVESAPRRLRRTEQSLIDTEPSSGGVGTAARTVLAEELEPMVSDEYPAAYRLRIATMLLDHAIKRLVEEALALVTNQIWRWPAVNGADVALACRSSLLGRLATAGCITGSHMVVSMVSAGHVTLSLMVAW